uniref:Ribonuclease H-like domain-containing protein n=1 Tax=Tanacetum cinerariifolium TaxID=118510 RepID=A0A699GQH3_TANCI|nr:ribonuclease H-like domain-containing protein [Tanacetum cinerariifolium]
MVLMAQSGTPRGSPNTSQVKTLQPSFNFAKGSCRFSDSFKYIHDANARSGNNNNGTTNRGRGTVDSENTTNALLTKLLQQLGSLDYTHSPTRDLYPVTTPSPITHSFLQIIRSLHQEFAMTDLGPLNYFLGISVTRDSSGLFLSQKKYAIEILDRARSLQYLTFTRPDISYVVQQVCLYILDPQPHSLALKRIFWYVRGTLDYGLQVFSSSTTNLVAYSNADWAGCPITRRSTLGCYAFFGNNLLSWSSKRQPMLSRSSAEAEYCGVANNVAETCWRRSLLHELYTPLSSATLVYCDNVSAVYLSCNPVQQQRTMNIEIDIHFFHDLVATGQFRVLHVPSCYQFADIFTKESPSALLKNFAPV